MAFDIRPLTPDDLSELSHFLIEGFHAPADAAFAAPEVLRWKYLDPLGIEAGDAPRSYLGCEPSTGRIVGHLGVCPGRFHGAGLPAEGVSTLHMIDWLASVAGTGVGATLMRRAHRNTACQYGLGGSDAGRGVGGGGGYGLVRLIPVYQRVFRPAHRLRVPGHGRAVRWLRAARDVATRLTRPPRRPRTHIDLQAVETFGGEITPILDAYGARAVFTTRAPDLLNHVLHYPRSGVTGWHLLAESRVRGFAMLSLVPRPGGVRLGKVVDCVVDLDDPDLWHASAVALTNELARQGADVAQAFASTAWSVRAWRSAGFSPVHDLEFRLRNRSNRLPPAGASTFHLTPLEADYAYT